MTFPAHPAQPTPPDLCAETLQWIDARIAECEAATPGPWHRDFAVGHPGYSDGTHDYQVWNSAGLCVADVGARDAQFENGNADFIASSRTALPLALKALRVEVEAHKSTGGKHEFCTRCGEPLQVWPCPALRRIHQSIFGGSNEQ